MQILAATANTYFLPFETTLELIASAGFTQLELDLFWERKQWAMAQHLRGWSARDMARQIHQAGLRVASIHDGGGVLERPDSTCGFINPQLIEVLYELGEPPDTLVFHTPHIEGSQKAGWWRSLRGLVAAALELYRGACRGITIENMPNFEGYTVPMLTPEDLAAFAAEAHLEVTLDTTHYAQIGIELPRAAQALSGLVRTVHLSDYRAGKTHVFPGKGELDLPGFLAQLDPAPLRSITLECAPAYPGEDPQALEPAVRAQRLSEARRRVERWVQDCVIGFNRVTA